MHTPPPALALLLAFGLSLQAHAVTNPVVNGAVTAVYANVTDPIKLAFAPDGTLFVGRDNSGSGGSAGDAVKIHRVAPGGSPVTEYGAAAIPDPDAVAYDALGIVSGTPGAVLVGGSAVGTGAVISKINTNGAVTQLFGGVQANMNNPGELLFDASGRLYISDSGSNRVFATSSSAAPTNLISFSGAYELALDVSNRLAVGSFNSLPLFYYTTNGVPAGSGPPINDGSPVVAGPGDEFWGRELYAVNSLNQLIRIDSFGNMIAVGTNFDGVISMAFGPGNALYVSYRDYDVILRIAPFSQLNAHLSYYATAIDPQTLSFAPDGTLYTGRDNSGSGGTSADAVKINRLGPGGSPVTEFGNVAIPDPDAVAYDAAGVVSGLPGSVIVGGLFSGLNGQLSRVAPNGTVTNIFGPISTIQNPIKFTFTSPTRLLFTDAGVNAVLVMTNPTPQVFFSTPSPYSFAVDGLGRVVVSSISSPQLRLYSAAGTLLNNNFAIAMIRSPLARGPGGVWGTNVYFVAPNGQLQSISPAGLVTEHGAGFAAFEDMEFGPDGELYLSDLETDRIMRATLSYLPQPDHWWPADGNASNAISTAHGTLVGGVTYQPGKYGQAFVFDAVASEINCGTNAGNFGSGDFTVMYWMKTTNQAIMYLMSKWPGCGYHSFWSVLMNAGRTGLQTSGDTSGTTYMTTGGTTNNLADNQWHHFAMVRRGVALSCYQDGVLARISSSNFVANISNATLFKLGTAPCITFPTPPSQRYHGLLDEIRLYHCALTPAQIADAAGIANPNRPTLNIAALPGAVRLTWTTNATGYLLETNNALTPPAGWGVLTSNYSVIETNYAVTNTIGGARRFYRLYKP